MRVHVCIYVNVHCNCALFSHSINFKMIFKCLAESDWSGVKRMKRDAHKFTANRHILHSTKKRRFTQPQWESERLKRKRNIENVSLYIWLSTNFCFISALFMSLFSPLLCFCPSIHISLWPQYIRCGCRNSYVIPLHRSLNFVYSPFRVVLCASRQNMCAQTCMKLCICCGVCAWWIHFWRECALIWID